MAILIWLIAAYGMSNILVYSSIFAGMREFFKKWGSNKLAPLHGIGQFISDLLSCMMCTSTWVGFFLGSVIFSPNHEIFKITEYGSWFFDGVFASGCVWAINSIIEWFEENRPAK